MNNGLRRDWRKCSLGEAVTFQRGFDITRPQQVDGPYPVISSSGHGSSHAEFKVKGPGVVIGRKGTLGTVFYSPGDYWPHDTTLWVKDFHGNDPKFVHYFLKTLRLEQYDAGASNPTLNRNHIQLLSIEVPSPVTQRKIATLLSAYDDLIENNTRRIAILEEMARSLYREWFVDFRFPGHDLAANTDSRSGPVPSGWRLEPLGRLSHEKRRSVQPDAIDPSTPYVGLEHIPRRSIAISEWGTAAEVQSTKFVFNRGDVLFGKIRPYFHKVGVPPVDGICSSDAIVIAATEAVWYPLVLSCVSSDEFVEHATLTSNGTKMPRANWAVLVKYPVAIPPRPLLDAFNALITDAVEQIRLLVLRNQNLRATRDLLLPRLISGEVYVADLDIDLGTAEGSDLQPAPA